MAGKMFVIYNSEMYRVQKDDFSYRFETKRKAFDKGSRDSLKKFSKKYFKTGTYNPSVSFTKKGLSADDANKRFLDGLAKGLQVNTRKYSGKFEKLGTLSLSKGNLHFEFEKRDTYRTPLEDLFAKNVLGIIDKNKFPIIIDPKSPDAKALVGKNVEISKTYSFTECKRVRLTEIFEDSPLPFCGLSEDGKQACGVFMREFRLTKMPLDLNDKAVRDSLRGKWIFNKANGQECMVTSFRKVDGHYQCNGIDARSLMDSWEFENGGFIGVEI